jgi:hypothetical protein
MSQIIKYDYRAIVVGIPYKRQVPGTTNETVYETRFYIIADVDGLFANNLYTVILNASLQINTNVKIYNYPFLTSQFMMNTLAPHQCSLSGISFAPGVVGGTGGSHFISLLKDYVQSRNAFSSNNFLNLKFGLARCDSSGCTFEIVNLLGMMVEFKMSSNAIDNIPYVNFSCGIILPAYVGQAW